MSEQWNQWDQVRREKWPDAIHETFSSYQGVKRVAGYDGRFDRWVQSE